jgi:3-hydroxyisobutyrate dehydrogenase
VDHTTSQPNLAVRIHEECRKYKVGAVDAPVSGGDVGAREGKLVIMCGGDKGDFEMVEPVMKTYGKNVHLNGTAGQGQHTKLVNQIVLAGNMLGLV